MEGTRREKSISQSLFIKWCSATERWNNQKPNRCTARGNDREEGNSQLDRTVKSKPISTCWHTCIWTNTDSTPLWPSYTKKGKKVWVQQSERKAKREGEWWVYVGEGMRLGKWEWKRRQLLVSKWQSESQSTKSLVEAYQVGVAEKL